MAAQGVNYQKFNKRTQEITDDDTESTITHSSHRDHVVIVEEKNISHDEIQEIPTTSSTN